MPARPDRHLEGPPRREGHGHDEALVRGDDAVGAVVGSRRVAREAASLASAVAAVGLGLRRRDRRDVVERVDLPVRVRDGGADLGAPVLEDADVCVRGIRPELASAVDPDRDDARELDRRQLAERGVVPVRVENDLAAPLCRSGRAVEERRRRRVGTERREPVVEDGRVVRKGNLDPARTERAPLGACALRRRVERPRVPRRRDPDPRLGEHVEALVDLGAVAGRARPLLVEGAAQLPVDEQPSPVGMDEHMPG